MFETSCQLSYIKALYVDNFSCTSLIIVIVEENVQRPYPFLCTFLFTKMLQDYNTLRVYIIPQIIYTLRVYIIYGITFWSYNFVLNEAPNNNDIMCLVNNVHFTTMGVQQFSLLHSHHAEKPTYVPEMRNNDMKTRKVYADGGCSGKEWRLYTQQFRQQVDWCGQAVSE